MQGQLSCSYALGASFPTLPRCQVPSANSAEPSDVNMAPGSSADQRQPLVVTRAMDHVNTGPHCRRAMDPHMVFNGSSGQDFSMASGGIAGSPQQAVPHYCQLSSSIFLYCAHILQFFFLFHHSTTYFLILVTPGAAGCLPQGSPQVRSALPVQVASRPQSLICQTKMEVADSLSGFL